MLLGNRVPGASLTRFVKAQPAQARLKVSIYGPPGSGKTFTTLLMAEGLARHRGKRIAFVDTERGTDFYAQHVAQRRPHPEAFEFDAIYTRSLAEITDAIRSLNPNEHGIVVLDSISHLWESAMDAYNGKRTKIDSIPMHAWAKIKKPYKDLIKFLIGSSFDVFILGRQKNIFEDDAQGEMKKIGVAMRAEGETAYEPHICMRMESLQDAQDSTKSHYYALVEKDRTGCLSGRTFKNPDFRTVEVLLPLLGETQAPEEDDEDRAAKDAELLERGDEERAKSKEGKSRALRLEYVEKLSRAASAVQLKEIAEQIRKQSRHILPEDRAVMAEAYRKSSDRFTEQDAAADAQSLDNFGAGLASAT